MRSSYREEDVIFLLKDITGMIDPLPTQERERMIQSGKHYSEMLPLEYVPSARYMEIYENALQTYAKSVAAAVGILSDRILERRGEDVVLVSLARAGTPIGILLRRYFRFKYDLDIPHYSISIIRGRGIDENAMRYLLERYEGRRLLFIDGWIGKGAILGELRKDMECYEGVSPEIGVLADPANETQLCGTHEDILIPSSCLNSTVSGLVSRTVLRDDLIGKDDFHGAVYYSELRNVDLSYQFIEAIEKEFVKENPAAAEAPEGRGITEVEEIARHFGVEDINKVKPGIGETTRVLLRRVPWMVLIDERHRDNPELEPIVRLAKEKGTPVEYYPLQHYKCCGIIKKLADA